MSREPTRWKDSTEVDALTRQLFGAGRKTSSLPSTTRMRGERRLAKVAAAPVVVLGVGLWSKAVAAAFGAGFASALAVVTVSPALREKLWHESASSQPGAALPPSNAPATSPPRSPSHEPASNGEAAVVVASTGSPPADGEPSPAARRANPTSHIARTNVPSPRSSPGDVDEPHALPPMIAQPAPALSGLGVTLPVAPAQAAPPAGDGLSAEVQLLAQARSLVNADPNGALELLNRHARLFPGGALAMEREVLVIEALARSGRTNDALARAKELLAASPGALYTARLQRIVDRGTR